MAKPSIIPDSATNPFERVRFRIFLKHQPNRLMFIYNQRRW